MENINTDLSESHHLDFTTLWELKTDWFEAPNIRRGGWSGVIKLPLKQPDGQSFFIFIKRQENHLSRTWRHPISGVATFQKEYDNLNRFHLYKIPTLELVYFGTRSYNGDSQAILVTKELAGYQPLDVLLLNSSIHLVTSKPSRLALLKATAKMLCHMHQHRMQHNSLYPKHIFAKPVGDSWDIRLIDLETARRRLFKSSAVIRDLCTLKRQTKNLSRKDQVIFFKAYVDEAKLSPESKKLWFQIQDRILKKSK